MREGDSGPFGSHTRPATPICDMGHVKYDVLVPLESLFAGFESVARAAPAVKLSLLTSGWEDCTHDGAPSILGGAPEQGHLDSTGSSSGGGGGSKERQLDRLLCNDTTARAVYHRYALDYAAFAESPALRRTYGAGPHRCLT